jgi:hypothetical protein
MDGATLRTNELNPLSWIGQMYYDLAGQIATPPQPKQNVAIPFNTRKAIVLPNRKGV